MIIRLKERLISIYIIVILITMGFAGVMVFDGVVDYGGVMGATITVDASGGGDYLKIQEAIDAANPGDTINVKQGSYYENIVINKTLSLVGSGYQNTSIFGSMWVVHAVRIEADYVNFSGFYVTTNYIGSSAGIRLYYSNYCHVFDNFCDKSTAGVFLSLSDYNLIENNNLSSNDYENVELYRSNYNTITSNTCDTGVTGLLIIESHYNSFINNSCAGNDDYGIYLEYSNSNIVESNHVRNNQKINVYILGSTNNILRNNEVLGPGSGITLTKSETTTLTQNKLQSAYIHFEPVQLSHTNTHTIDTQNTVDGYPVYYWKNQTSGQVPGSGGQVILANCKYVNAQDNDQNKNSFGLDAYYSDNLTVLNLERGVNFFNTHYSTIQNATGWINLEGSDHNLINKSNCSGYGISLKRSSDYNRVTNNLAANGPETGILSFQGDGNEIINNICNFNARNGIQIDYSSFDIIEENTCISNGKRGIYSYSGYENRYNNNTVKYNPEGIDFDGMTSFNDVFDNDIAYNHVGFFTDTDDDNNYFYHNNFVQNAVQVYNNGTNYWNNSAQKGNYWSDYTGVDTNSDGIGDTNLPHLGLDSYPYVTESGWRPETPRFTTPGGVDDDGDYRLAWQITARTTGYVLEESDNDRFLDSRVIFSGTNNYFDVAGQKYGEFYYRVKAVNADCCSKWSDSVKVTILFKLDIPGEFIAEAYPGGNALNLSWKRGPAEVIGYELYSNHTGTWELLVSPGQANSTYNHSGLTDGVKYYYRLRAKATGGYFSEFTENITGIPADSMPPATPAGFSVIEVTTGSITLSWEANQEDDIVGYNIYRREYLNTSGWDKPHDTVMVGHEYYEDTGLGELRNYFYALTAFDEVPNESPHTEMLSQMTILGEKEPEINNTLRDFSIREDTYNDMINLYIWFKDRNGDKLEFGVEGQRYIDVYIYQDNGTVILRPDKNWNGYEKLRFYARDKAAEISDDVIITVTAVNDPPGPAKITNPKDGFKTNDTVYLNFEGFCEPDPDMEYGDKVKYTWYSNISGKLGEGDRLRNIKLKAGVHLITLEATDLENAKSVAQIKISVAGTKGSQTDDGDGGGGGGGDLIVPSSTDSGLFALFGIMLVLAVTAVFIIIIIVVIIAVFVLRKRRREAAATPAEQFVTEPQQAPPEQNLYKEYETPAQLPPPQPPPQPQPQAQPIAEPPPPPVAPSSPAASPQEPAPVEELQSELSPKLLEGLRDGSVQYTKPVPPDSTAPRMEDVLFRFGDND